MAPGYSKLIDSSAERVKYYQMVEAAFPPPILFKDCFQVLKDLKKGTDRASSAGKTKDDDGKKSLLAFNSQEFEIKVNPDDEDSPTVKRTVPIFEDGDALKYCMWRKKIDGLFDKMDISYVEEELPPAEIAKTTKQTQYFKALMDGKALDNFTEILATVEVDCTDPEYEYMTPREQLEEALRRLAAVYIPVTTGKNYGPIDIQRNYIQTELFMTEQMEPEVFTEVLMLLNDLMVYFPGNQHWEEVTNLGDEELLRALSHTVKQTRPQFFLELMSGETNPFDFDSLKEATKTYQRLHTVEKLKKKLTGKTQERTSKKKTLGDKKRKKEECTHCKGNHPSDSCWTLEKNAHLRPKNWKPPGSRGDKKTKYANKKTTFTMEQVHAMMQTAMKTKTSTKKKKREVHFDPSDEDSNIVDSLMSMHVKDCNDSDSD